jgi:hypothetical protein
LPQVLSDWDAETLLQLSRVLVVGGGLRDECGLPSNTDLAAVVTWHSTGSGLRDEALFQALPHRGQFEGRLELELPGAELGGELRLSTRVVLDQDVSARKNFEAHLAGSILWEDVWSVRLEGDEPAFPISMLDFAATNFDVNAEWHLDVYDDPTVAAMGALRLYLNTRFPGVIRAFANASDPDPVERLILGTVKTDVERLLVQSAFDLEDDVAWEEGSLGYLLVTLTQSVFEGDPLPSLRARARAYPASFDTELRARIGPILSDVL